MSKTRKNANIASLVAQFQNDNKPLLEAMKVFDVSNAEYERAMRALTTAPSLTTSSTQQARVEEWDAPIME